MGVSSNSVDAADVQAASDLYQQAAQALLLAYQRNKEATRHHTQGAFRAALHHARMSVEHVNAAQAHLEQALARSTALSNGLQAAPFLPSADSLHKTH